MALTRGSWLRPWLGVLIAATILVVLLTRHSDEGSVVEGGVELPTNLVHRGEHGYQGVGDYVDPSTLLRLFSGVHDVKMIDMDGRLMAISEVTIGRGGKVVLRLESLLEAESTAGNRKKEEQLCTVRMGPPSSDRSADGDIGKRVEDEKKLKAVEQDGEDAQDPGGRGYLWLLLLAALSGLAAPGSEPSASSATGGVVVDGGGVRELDLLGALPVSERPEERNGALGLIPEDGVVDVEGMGIVPRKSGELGGGDGDTPLPDGAASDSTRTVPSSSPTFEPSDPEDVVMGRASEPAQSVAAYNPPRSLEEQEQLIEEIKEAGRKLKLRMHTTCQPSKRLELILPPSDGGATSTDAPFVCNDWGIYAVYDPAKKPGSIGLKFRADSGSSHTSVGVVRRKSGELGV